MKKYIYLGIAALCLSPLRGQANPPDAAEIFHRMFDKWAGDPKGKEVDCVKLGEKRDRRLCEVSLRKLNKKGTTTITRAEFVGITKEIGKLPASKPQRFPLDKDIPLKDLKGNKLSVMSLEEFKKVVAK